MNPWITVGSYLVVIAVGASLGANYTGNKWKVKYTDRENVLLKERDESRAAAEFVTREFEQHARSVDKWRSKQLEINDAQGDALRASVSRIGELLNSPTDCTSVSEAGKTPGSGESAKSSVDNSRLVAERTQKLSRFLERVVTQGERTTVDLWACYHAINGTPPGDLK